MQITLLLNVVKRRRPFYPTELTEEVKEHIMHSNLDKRMSWKTINSIPAETRTRNTPKHAFSHCLPIVTSTLRPAFMLLIAYLLTGGWFGLQNYACHPVGLIHTRLTDPSLSVQKCKQGNLSFTVSERQRHRGQIVLFPVTDR